MKTYPKKMSIEFSLGGLKVVVNVRDKGKVRLNFYELGERIASWGWTFKDVHRYDNFVDFLRDVEGKLFVNYIESFPTKKEEEDAKKR